ncbi:hypothetical protein [Pontibacter fetidus]|uniref:Uncharacterized protein n=1 Tax=Pontibacter fetidus TaxID=2700082 RepID=A0A6B2H7C9_9BACT|nr:hypothetical protein [Pontibacter fetidus]NDK55840.1 hypothetical protein [Pontibacter fetidus]
MNYNQHRYENDRGSFHTHRSERYRNPDQYSEGSFDSNRHADRDRANYGNDFYRSSQRRNPQDWNPEHIANRGLSTYATARNYGNMGSYGGAQGFGSSRGGYSSQRQSSDMGSGFSSGHGRYERTNYGRGTNQGRSRGYENDYDSHGQNSDNYSYERGSNRDLYGDYTSRRFQGSHQDRYDFDRDEYRTRSYGGDRGNYMGSGYERTPRRNEYGSTRGDYGSSGRYLGRSTGSYDQPYGMSGYYQGGYYDDTDYNSYSRDRDERQNDW